MGAGCTAPNCTNSSSKGFVMFRYPKDEELKTKWLQAIGRPDWRPYSEARLCEMHFLPHQWNKTSVRLEKDAVPLPPPLAKCTCKREDLNSVAYSTVRHDHSYLKPVDPGCRIHGRRSSVQATDIKYILKENCQLKQQVAILTPSSCSSPQNESKERGRPRIFSGQDVKNAMQLRLACGSAGFNFVRNFQNSLSPGRNVIPAIRSIQGATQHIKFAPGVLEEIMVPLKKKFMGFTDIRDKDINIVFDELVTKRRVDYDSSLKRFIGYGTMPGQEKEIAEKGEIYVFRGIHQRLKQIVGYHLNPKEVNVIQKKEVILQLLREAKGMGANVISLVCGNRGLLSALGFSTCKDSLKWCISNPVDSGAKLWCVPDPVHVFKALKGCMLSNRFMELPMRIVAEFGLPSATVDFAHVEFLEEFQRDDDLHMVPGLTLKCINASHFSKMKVKSATKVINPRTAAGLEYLSVKGLVSEEFQTTAWFLKVMNRWFQLMTSRNLQFALGLRKNEVYEEAIEHLKLVIFVFKYVKIPGGWKPVQSSTIFATYAILEIQQYLLHERGYEFLQTSPFTTDCVENINSRIRIVYKNPSNLEFKNRLKHIAISQFQAEVKSSSYDYDEAGDYIDLLLDPKEDTNINETFPELDLSSLKWISTVPPTAMKPHHDDVFYRMCGYVIRSLKKRKMLTCIGCLEKLKHCGDSVHRHGLFLELTNFVPGAQFPVCDEVFQMFRLIEYNLKLWTKEIQHLPNLDLVTERLIQPAFAHMSLPTCHDIKQRLVKAFCNMHFRQIAVRSSPTEGNTASSLASKSAGGQYLAEKYRAGIPSTSKSSPCQQKKTHNGLMNRVIDLP